MFGLFSKEDPNLKRNRKTQELRNQQQLEQWQQQRQEQQKNLKQVRGRGLQGRSQPNQRPSGIAGLRNPRG